MAYLTIDVGGTFIKYATADVHYCLSAAGQIATPRTNQAAFLETIENIFDSREAEITAVAISLPGTIDTQTGLVIQGGSLTYNTNQYVGKQLEGMLHVPVSIHNDAKCAAMAELTLGNMREVKDGIVLVFGTGLGGCLIQDHQIRSGHNFFAGELSAMLIKDVKAHGLSATLGARAGIPSLVKQVMEAKKCTEEVDGHIVFEWIQRGDPIATSLLQAYCWDMVIQIYNLQCMFDPQRICIGGGVSAQPLFIKTLQRMQDQLYEILPKFIPRAELMTCHFYNDSNMLGALCFHLQEHLN